MANVEHQQHRSERSAHAVYGLVIITSALVADGQSAADALTSLMVLWGAGLVLVLAHVYSAAVAEVDTEGRWLSHAEQHVLIADNIPVLAALVVPSILLVAAGLGLLELALAIELSIALSVAALFFLGTFQAHRNGASLGVQLGIGALGGAVGVAVIALEVFLGH
jgi:hypothetical protein